MLIKPRKLTKPVRLRKFRELEDHSPGLVSRKQLLERKIVSQVELLMDRQRARDASFMSCL